MARILVNEVTRKPTIVYIKFDDENAGNLVIDKSADIFAIENKVVPIKPILAKIKLNPRKRSSPEIERLQFPLALAWTCTVHKVQGLQPSGAPIQKTIIKGPLKYLNDQFSYTFLYLKPEKDTPFHAEPPHIGHYQTSQPQNTENLETDAKKSGDFSKNLEIDRRADKTK